MPIQLFSRQTRINGRQSPGGIGRLWAPWRGTYIAQSKLERRRCAFCQAKRSRDDRKAYVVCRGRHVFCLLNRYPYNTGHLMIASLRHVAKLSQLSAQEASELMEMTRGMVELLAEALRPHGFNVGLNLGLAAGAGIPGHLHLHIVPRWVGDTNFMPIVGGTKVLSQSLDSLYLGLNRLVQQRKLKSQ